MQTSSFPCLSPKNESNRTASFRLLTRFAFGSFQDWLQIIISRLMPAFSLFNLKFPDSL